MVKVIFQARRNWNEFASSGSEFFCLREVSIMKRGPIEENHYLIQ